MEDAVLFSLKGQVAIITMNRPHSLNSMNEALIDGLHEALTKVEKDPAIKCAVLTGNGKAFCAGGDLPFLETLADTAVKKAFITKVGQVAKRITTIEKPIIAMVNGVTAGAGVNLMLACDLIYAVDTAKFAQSFAKVGLIPDCGGLYFLPKAVGVHKAAATAEKMALVNHIFPAAELEDAVMQMAERLAASAPLAIGLIKKYLNNTAMTLDEVLEMEAVAQPLCMGTDDSAEGITAFKEKRTPKFTGK